MLDLSGMVDSLIARASIGSVIASSLGAEDPEKNPAYADLPDEEFDKIALKMNATRDVFGIISILSLTWGKDKWLKQILDYILQKSEKFCSENDKLKQILKSKNVGLLVNERMINLTPEIAPDLHT